MKVALIGTELEENLGLRYMASSLEVKGHTAEIIPFNEESDITQVIDRLLWLQPDIAGLSMVFTGRAKEFCRLAKEMRSKGFAGHITAGGHFAALNCMQLMTDFPEFDSVALGEGEDLICDLSGSLQDLSNLAGFCFRRADGTIKINPSRGNPEDLDLIPFPKRDNFYEYFGKPIGSILSSRGCWRNCAFCSINAWYKSGGGKKFRIRGIPNIISEMKYLYFTHKVRIFNFQDDNFFLPDREETIKRFTELREGLWAEGVKDTAIAVKARPDSINYEAIKILDDLGLFRVFLGVENASEEELKKLNRKCSREQIENALRILNDFDIHIAYNLLIFEPDTTMQDILTNLKFMERHIDNPFNFCRAEAYAGTGLEDKLKKDNILIGDYFGFDYRIKDPRVETFHRIANYAFFDRNFSDFGLHYFNMEIDFSYQILRRFYPSLLNQEIRGEVRSFIKETNIDTYRSLCAIYDIAMSVDTADERLIRSNMRKMRFRVDDGGAGLRVYGEDILKRLRNRYEKKEADGAISQPWEESGFPVKDFLLPYDRFRDAKRTTEKDVENSFFGILKEPIPYDEFRKKLDGRDRIN